jgi:hypothetical protein
VIECEPRLQQLFKRSFGKATIVASQQTAVLPAWWADESGIDVRIAAGSLPRQFRRNATAFPRHHGYLRPNPDRTAYWRDRLAGIGPGLKVGISWRGGMPSTRRELRSIDLAAWARVLRTHGAQFVSLQYGDIIGELQRLKREQAVDLHCWQEAIDDLDEAAALISGLDVVISVCTAVIHLTGALGRPVWVLVPTSPEWRYLAEGSSMPWYPSARLYRQRAQGEWQPVLDEVAADLERLFAQAQEGADDSGATRGLNG